MTVGPVRPARVGLLAIRHIGANRARTALLVVMVTVGLVIFLVVQGLARASTTQLSSSIERDLGVAGTYQVTLPTGLGEDVGALVAHLDRVLDARQARARLVVADHGSVVAGCPSDTGGSDEERPVFVLLRADHVDRLLAASDEEAEPADGSGSARTCLAGIEHVPDQDLDRPLSALLRVEQPAVFDRSLLRAISLALDPPTSVTAVVGFSHDRDQAGPLRSSLIRSLADGAARSGQDADWDDGIVVSRLDTGAAVRDAGEGVRLVYQLLAWGILGLGGLAVLVAQLMNTQQRTWFFGLARVVGATSADLALLVALDVLVTIAASTFAAITVALAFRGRLETWSAQTFDQELVLLDAGSIPSLVAGATFVALLGAVLPAIKAVRLDPLDALER